jgi:DNA-binding response OmpR family regulator
MARLLVLEPDVRLAALYAGALRARQHQVVTALSAQDAVLAADTAKPDLVLLELQLTAHSGIEFLYEFRSYPDWRQIPVVVLSTVPPAEFANSRQLLHGRLGVVSYHYKPRTSLQVLLHAVDNALQAAGGAGRPAL